MIAWDERRIRRIYPKPTSAYTNLRDRAMVAGDATRRLAATSSGLLAPPIREDAAQRGQIAGRVLAVSRLHVAITTAARAFTIIEIAQLDRVPSVDERVRLDFRDGRAVIRDVRGPGDRSR